MLSSLSTTHFIVVVALLIVSITFLDNIIGSSFLYTYEARSSFSSLVFLILLFITNIIGQLFLIYSVMKTSRSIAYLKKNKFLTASHLLIVTLVIINVSLFLLLMHDSFEDSRYDLPIFGFFIAYNLTASMILVGALAFKFLTWLMRNRNITIFLYGIAFAIFFLAISSALITILTSVEGYLPKSVSPVPNPWDRTSTRHLIYTELYNFSSIVLFGLFWLSTSLMLMYFSKNYARGVGKKKFWILVSLPLIYFLASTDFILNQLSTVMFQYPSLSIFFVYLFGATKNIGGVFFAISFILMSKNASNKNLKVFLAISAAGIMMLFSSLQISVLQLLPYPAFGLVTLSIMPLSSYLLLIGLYYSALSIAYDSRILTSLKKRVKEKPSAFLSGIGSAEWSKSVEGVIHSIMERTEEPPGRTDSELSSEDVQRYLLEVIEELKHKKT